MRREKRKASGKAVLEEKEKELKKQERERRSSIHVFNAVLKNNEPSQTALDKANQIIAESPRAFKSMIWSCNWSEGGSFTPMHGFSALIKGDEPLSYSLFDTNKLCSGISVLKLKGLTTRDNQPINSIWIANHRDEIKRSIENSIALTQDFESNDHNEISIRSYLGSPSKMPSTINIGNSSSSFVGVYQSEEKSFNLNHPGYKDNLYIVCQAGLPELSESVCKDIHGFYIANKSEDEKITFKNLLNNYDGIRDLEKANINFRKGIIQKIGDALKLTNFNVEFSPVIETTRYALTELDSKYILYNAGTLNVSPSKFQKYEKTHIPISENPYAGLSLVSLEKPQERTGTDFFTPLAFPLSTGKLNSQDQKDIGRVALTDDLKGKFIWKPHTEIPIALKKNVFRSLDLNFSTHLNLWGLRKKIQLRPVLVAMSNF